MKTGKTIAVMLVAMVSAASLYAVETAGDVTSWQETLNIDGDQGTFVAAGSTGIGSITVASGDYTINTLYLGRNAGTEGSLRVSGSGSTFNAEGWYSTYVGNSGTGSVEVVNGADATVHTTLIGNLNGSSGSVLVHGAGSTFTDSGTTAIARNTGTTGSLTVSGGGQYSSVGGMTVGEFGGAGSATVSGAGSSLATSLGIDVVNGSLNILNGASMVNYGGSSYAVKIGANASLNVDVSGNNHLTASRISNSGEVNLTAAAGLSAGNYTPFSSDVTGTINTFGGKWVSTMMGTDYFQVGAAQALTGGTQVSVNTSTSQRADVDNGNLFLAFLADSGTFDFTAVESSSEDLGILASMLAEEDNVVGAWDFTMGAGYTGDSTMLSYYVGSGYTSAEDFEIWHFDGLEWTAFSSQDATLTDDGYLNFGVDGFSSYAVTSAVPEPATIAMLGVGGLILALRRRFCY